MVSNSYKMLEINKERHKDKLQENADIFIKEKYVKKLRILAKLANIDFQDIELQVKEQLQEKKVKEKSEELTKSQEQIVIEDIGNGLKEIKLLRREEQEQEQGQEQETLHIDEVEIVKKLDEQKEELENKLLNINNIAILESYYVFKEAYESIKDFKSREEYDREQRDKEDEKRLLKENSYSYRKIKLKKDREDWKYGDFKEENLEIDPVFVNDKILLFREKRYSCYKNRKAEITNLEKQNIGKYKLFIKDLKNDKRRVYEFFASIDEDSLRAEENQNKSDYIQAIISAMIINSNKKYIGEITQSGGMYYYQNSEILENMVQDIINKENSKEFREFRGKEQEYKGDNI